MAFDVWKLFEAIGSALFVLCLVPQMVRTLSRGRANDVSLGFLVLVNVGSLVLIAWALHGGNYFFTGSLVANLIVWGTVCYYRIFPRQVEAEAVS